MKKLAFLALALVFCAKPDRAPADRTVEIMFSPRGGVQDALVSEIDRAKREVVVAMYTFSSRELAQALVGARDRGVKVRVVLDGESSRGSFSKSRFLATNGVDVRVDQTHLGSGGEGRGIMHNKFAVIDGVVVATGSYNWTASAEEYNDENLLLIRHAPEIVALYSRKFKELYNRAVPQEQASAGQSAEPKLLVMADDLVNLRRHAGERAIVKGVITRTAKSKRSETYFLDFGPDRDAFTAVIFSSAVADFFTSGIDPLLLKGKKVAILGEIKNSPRYGLEMILDSPQQLRILNE